MEKKSKTNPGQLIEFAPDSYLDRTSRPIYALAYLLGFLILYEIGTIAISPEVLTQSLASQQIRVVSFLWLQQFVTEILQFSPRMAWLVTPLVVVVILLAMQITSRKSWKVRFGDFIPMTVECVLLAMPLIALSLFLNRVPAANSAIVTPCMTMVPSSPPQLLVDIVTGIGAGIYEELIFRLILISLLMLVFQDFLKCTTKNAIIFSVLISAGLFSIHHHIFPLNGTFETGEVFTAARFVFRTAAGIYFAGIFALRGFGIAAGAHAIYDIFAAILNALVAE
jgi:hypothetical protein